MIFVKLLFLVLATVPVFAAAQDTVLLACEGRVTTTTTRSSSSMPSVEQKQTSKTYTLDLANQTVREGDARPEKAKLNDATIEVDSKLDLPGLMKFESYLRINRINGDWLLETSGEGKRPGTNVDVYVNSKYEGRCEVRRSRKF